MGKSYKAASSIGAAALVLSGSVMAATPIPNMDKWSVSAGTITANACTELGVGFTCGAPLSDKGFFQRMLTTTNGTTFFQTIITENDANSAVGGLDALKFSDESFVRTGNTNGILDKQRIAEERFNNGVDATKGSTTFKASTSLSSGWAGSGLSLKQYLYDDFDGFQTDFLFAQLGDSSINDGAEVYAKGMKITAYVPIKNADRQDFVLVDLQGDFVNVVSNPPSPGKSSVTIPGKGTMEWWLDTSPGNNNPVKGERIQAVWVAQDLSEIVGQKFGFTSYNNLTSADVDFIADFSLTNTAPINWDQAVWGNLTTTGPITAPFAPFQ